MKIPAQESIHVVVVDDHPGIRELIVDYLGDQAIKVTALADGRQLDEVLKSASVDLLILDLKLPGEDGMQIASRLRQNSDMPIIMLTARLHEADRVMGLEIGADDYLTKPFSPRELLARVRALLRRARARETVADGLSRLRGYRFAGWELNVRLRRLTTPTGQQIALSNTEFNLLAAFLTSPLTILSRDKLLDLSRMHNNEVYDRAIDVQIGRLRKKLELPDSATPLIKTERGLGYLFTAEPEALF